MRIIFGHFTDEFEILGALFSNASNDLRCLHFYVTCLRNLKEVYFSEIAEHLSCDY